MADIHAIRLRGPWGCEPLARSGDSVADLPRPDRVTIPNDWCGVCGRGFAGTVRFRRRFHWPGKLLCTERLWLVFDEVRSSAEIRLNDVPLGSIAKDAQYPFRLDITSRVEPSNVLEVIVTHDSPESSEQRFVDGGIVGEVRLEVSANTTA